MKTKSFLILLLMLGIVSCVGTVKDNSNQIDTTYKGQKVKIYFEGIQSATATGHSKIRVSFKPATGGSGSFSYQVYQNGNYSVPVASVSSKSARIDANGFINTTVDNLKSGKFYTFTVKAYDNRYETLDTNTAELTATTLNYLVPLFNGISSIENMAGISGKTQLLAKWSVATPAASSSDPFSANPHAVSGYNIYLGTSATNMTFIGSVNNPDSTQFLITGLIEGKNYFVRTRAKNSFSPPQEELNLEYAEKSTKTDAPIVFEGVQAVTIPKSQAGLNTINISWLPGSGNFDRYKIYLSTVPKSSFTPGVDSQYGSDIVSLGTTSLSVNVSFPHTIYYVGVVACNGPACTSFAGTSKVIPIQTSPPVAPFNGIKYASQPVGEAALSSIDLVWDTPDTTAGIYDYVRIFSTSSSGAYDPITDMLPTYDPNSPSIKGYDPTLTTLTGTRIKGLATGVEYCFVAEAYSVNPFDPLNPNGRATNSRKKVCVTPQYTYPGFTGVKPTCSNVQGTSLSISWSSPNPTGIFSMYEIYYRVGNSGFSVSDALAGAPGYNKLLASSSSTSFDITGLVPTSSYQMAVKTYFKHPVTLEVFRDSNLNVATCATSSAQVIHSGWKEIFAIGPKKNGLNGQMIMERLRTYGGTDFHGVMPMEDLSAVAGSTGSTEGIVRLVWDDFPLTAGLGNMRDYTGPSYPNNGYRVYRKVYSSQHDFLRPTLADSDWGAPVSGYLSSTPILDPNTSTFRNEVSFTDYTVQQSPVTDELKVYWYKVEVFLNGVKVDYDTIPPDGVVKVILPRKNQALVHRWMVNKQMCEMIGRAPSRANNYRCVYNGLASKNDNFDTGAHFISDRFEMGCKFSRGDDPDPQKKCTETVPGSNTTFLGGSTDSARGVKAGDCIFEGPVPNFSGINAKKGSVSYVRPYQSNWGGCWINTSVSGYGSDWVHLNNIESGSPVFPENSKYPISSNITPLGEAVAKEYVATDAKLGPVIHVNQYNALNLCKGFKVEIQKNDTKRLTIQKRLPARAEYLWMSFPPVDLKDSNLSIINSGSFAIGTQRRGCNTHNPSSSLRPAGGPTSQLNFNFDNWVAATASPTWYYLVTRSTGSYGGTTSPSGNGVAGTDYCQSKYGVQDLKGNVHEWVADQFSHERDDGISSGGVSFKWQDPRTRSIPFIQLEPEVLEYWKNGDGTYFQTLAYGPDRYTPMINYSSSWRGQPNISFVNPVVGLPLSCEGTFCSSATDDNVLVTLTSGPTARWLNSSSFNNNLSLSPSYTSNYSRIGMFNESESTTDHGPWGGFRHAHTYTYNATPSTGGLNDFQVGFRCLAKIKEDSNGKFEE